MSKVTKEIRHHLLAIVEGSPQIDPRVWDYHIKCAQKVTLRPHLHSMVLHLF